MEQTTYASAAAAATQVVTVVDPVTRLEGHLKVRIVIDTVGGVQQVVDARSSGTMFRGFELMLVGRDPREAQHMTQRICGVCPVSHGLASVLAQDAACRVTPPANARIMRNLVLGANYLQSHILHFYHLAVPDFVDGPAMPPWQPSWAIDRRFSAATSAVLVDHYVRALDMRRKAHEMGALFGGRLPHPPTYIAGGFTTTPRSDRINKFISYLNELIPFITNVYIPDAELLASTYADYRSIGAGLGSLLAYGVFDLNSTGTSKLLRRGRAPAGLTTIHSVELASINEQVVKSYYSDATNGLNPANGVTAPLYPKSAAYSWLKAPRYINSPYEVGPLARMWVNGDYRRGISTMDRHLARAYETLKVARAMSDWVRQLNPSGPVYTRATFPAAATGVGLTEAPRGALGHWIRIASGRLSHYQIITPTCWNASPVGSSGGRGPIERALIGTPIQDPDRPLEAMRVIHSFDPCLSCAVHVMRPGKEGKVFALGHDHD
ncbi:MAG: nickel-dependent hydrogenase large subunit [Armatimonadota bacterium]